MSDVFKITTIGDVWQPGDVVLDASGHLYVRSTHPQYVWGHPDEGALRDTIGRLVVPDGGVEDRTAVRPLTLLVRDGFAVGGRVIDEGDAPALD
ncbi:hypothetical protein ACFC26_08035 [Kitasatospora purpeofusca]|uniref:hypothetical protein n=1 Tax=Kitasatospora purpeofusca TaxID=67352 RepID=UPI0035D601BE